jgi:hypothetical protein
MRRIMRPSADDAGQPAAAAPETEAPIGEPNPGANPFARPADAATAQPADGDAAQPADAGAEAQATEARAVEPADTASATDETAVLPAVEPQAEDERPGSEGEQLPQPKRRLFRRRRAEAPFVLEEAPPPAVAEAAVVLPKPEGPAGLDPAEAEMRPPAGRRGRLRRRLRYLRRARELMLRDLGGLVYEIHRTGGGDMTSHAPIVTGKVDRIRQVDAESVALETALGAPRGETVVFQPGIGGTCVACGDLYPSDARFCANCGRSTTEPPVTEADAAAADPSPVDPRGTLNLFAPLEAERTAPAEEPAAIEMPAAQPTVTEPATAEEPTQGGEPAAPRHEPGVNGTAPPTLQPGDPLASRERS